MQEISGLALTRLEPTLRLVDHVKLTLTANKTVVAMTRAKRFQRIADLHGDTGIFIKAALRYGLTTGPSGKDRRTDTSTDAV
ncbi:protein of unknown function [Candidatus Filomicrobium marinum]|uniref:Uncharacterized protein n=1 Tax=Candidatus Filomicrobium marinum TaxID=1608628 RepID=A0A0D6JG66_9HYPH|nr:protein of unknown function [Candidatus Filomicrobium marinum]CPR19797.1 protein of unknown function [Candidatus Filomicrobium marinum]